MLNDKKKEQAHHALLCLIKRCQFVCITNALIDLSSDPHPFFCHQWQMGVRGWGDFCMMVKRERIGREQGACYSKHLQVPRINLSNRMSNKALFVGREQLK